MTKFDSKKPKEGKKYQVYFSGYEHPYVKSGYKVVRVLKKVIIISLIQICIDNNNVYNVNISINKIGVKIYK